MRFNSETKLKYRSKLVKIVWKRYDFPVAEPGDVNQRFVAELVAQLGRMAHGDGFVDGLTSAQWTALRYFSRANRFSRTVSAFAEFHATTRGTASQTVKHLVGQGYLSRTKSPRDGRSIRLDLTDKANAILADDPFEALVTAAGALSTSARQAVARSLERMLRKLAQDQDKRSFGMCPNCRYFEGEPCCTAGMPPYACNLFGEPLEDEETTQLCVNYSTSR